MADQLRALRHQLGMLEDAVAVLSLAPASTDRDAKPRDLPAIVKGDVDNASLRNALHALQREIRVRENNIANVATVGFKRSIVQFENLPQAQPAKRQGAVAAEDAVHGSGTKVRAVVRVHSPGCLEGTGRNLDVAIDGAGFLQVLAEDGAVFFTRDGQLQINADGKLATSGGLVITPEITFPQDLLDISVGCNGLVTGRTGGSADTTTHFGQIQIARFVNPAGLRAMGGNCYRETSESGAPIVGNPGDTGFGSIRHAFVERSNVELMTEFIALRTARRNRAILRQLLLR